LIVVKLVDGAGGEETEAATSLILGLPRPYIAIIVVLGIVSVAIVILVTVIATVCAPAETLHQFLAVIVIARYRPPGGRGEMICPRRWQFGGGISFRRHSGHHASKNRGGSTSARGQVRSPHISGGRQWLSYRQPACL